MDTYGMKTQEYIECMAKMDPAALLREEDRLREQLQLVQFLEAQRMAEAKKARKADG